MMGVRPMPAPSPLHDSVRGRRRAALGRIARALGSIPLQISDTATLWRERTRQRRALGGLNDYMLKDLGLSRADAGREGGKRFWEE